jgi:DNA-binding phage protein
MAKAKISRKQKPFSIEDMPIVKLRAGVKTEKHSPTEQLRDVEFTLRALTDAMLDGDHKAIKEIIRNHFEAINAAKVLKLARISKRTFYDAVSEKGNPSLKTLVQIVHAMKAAV